MSATGGGTTTTIDHFLAGKRLTSHPVHALLGVAVDVRIGNLDVPSFALSAMLPLKVFVGGP